MQSLCLKAVNHRLKSEEMWWGKAKRMFQFKFLFSSINNVKNEKRMGGGKKMWDARLSKNVEEFKCDETTNDEDEPFKQSKRSTMKLKKAFALRFVCCVN